MSRPSLASEVRQQLSRLGEMFGSPRRTRLDQNRQGRREHPDPTPIEVPIGYKHPPTLREQMQMYIREELSVQAKAQGLGSFDEENDFEAEDPDIIPLSGYEVHEYQFDEEPGSPLRDDPEFSPAEPSAVDAPSPSNVDGPGDAPPGAAPIPPAPERAGET